MGATRATQPANKATNNPVTTPPIIIAGRDRPAIRKPRATPGKMACDRASPIKLRRRKIKNTPSGPAAMDRAKVAAKARRIKPNSLKGPQKKSHKAVTGNPPHTNVGPDADFQIGRAHV